MKNFEETLKEIKEIIVSTARKYKIEIEKIFLFGSRARGDFEESSDWDILIITRERLHYNLRKKFLSKIRWELVNSGIVPEILIVDSKTFEDNKKYTGFVYYWVEKEGVVL